MSTDKVVEGTEGKAGGGDNDTDDDDGKSPATPTKPPPPPPPGPPSGGVSQPSEKSTSTPNATAGAASKPIVVVDPPSMTVALFFTWIIPVLLLALYSRKLVDTSNPTIPINKPIVKSSSSDRHMTTPTPSTSPMVDPTSSRTTPKQAMNQQKKKTPKPKKEPTPAPVRGPTAYQEIVGDINRRRRHIHGFSDASSLSSSSSSSASRQPKENPSTGAGAGAGAGGGGGNTKRSAAVPSDPMRARFTERIASLKEDYYERNPNDIYAALTLADAMRFYDMQFHEGGTYEMEALQLYDEIVERAIELRDAAIDQGKPTNQPRSSNSNYNNQIMSINDEVTLDYRDKSLDGMLCAIYTSRGKLYFMANMFERAVESYESCLEISPDYLDALDSRGSSLIVLGKYEQAARDFKNVIEKDHRKLFLDAFTGLARVLEAKEDALPGGWEQFVYILEQLIPMFELQLSNRPEMKQIIANALNRLYHVLFTYNDVKTKDYPEAFRHLTKAFQHKMSILPPWTEGNELAKINQSKTIFRPGFWPPNVGSQTKTPIFVIGFVRSGSTLLERILDAHPMIVGTGENSVFNGRLDDIRNQIVEVSISGQPNAIGPLTERLAEDVVDEMRRRWEIIDANTQKESDDEVEENPQRFVDKMLTNYYNIGFIQMLYPNALILHVVREPMDTLFSAYKHEFPPGTLDYTSDFKGLSELYIAYRDIMDHWDEVLPGRVTHIRYEDMVNDTPGMAKAIIEATGLPWDESVLDFHKKKHAVNTLSTTQVRKGIYKTSVQSWKRYEKQLQPLADLIGDYVEYNIQTSLPGYSLLSEENTEEA